MNFQGINNKAGFESTGACPPTLKSSDKPCMRCLSFFRGLVYALVLSGLFWWITFLFLADLFH